MIPAAALLLLVLARRPGRAKEPQGQDLERARVAHQLRVEVGIACQAGGPNGVRADIARGAGLRASARINELRSRAAGLQALLDNPARPERLSGQLPGRRSLLGQRLGSLFGGLANGPRDRQTPVKMGVCVA